MINWQEDWQIIKRKIINSRNSVNCKIYLIFESRTRMILPLHKWSMKKDILSYVNFGVRVELNMQMIYTFTMNHFDNMRICVTIQENFHVKRSDYGRQLQSPIKQKNRVTRARHRSLSREFSNHCVASGYVDQFSAWAHATFQYVRLRAFKMPRYVHRHREWKENDTNDAEDASTIHSHNYATTVCCFSLLSLRVLYFDSSLMRDNHI